MSIQMLLDKPCAIAPTSENGAIEHTHGGANKGKNNHRLPTIAITDRAHKQIAYMRENRKRSLKNCVMA